MFAKDGKKQASVRIVETTQGPSSGGTVVEKEQRSLQKIERREMLRLLGGGLAGLLAGMIIDRSSSPVMAEAGDRFLEPIPRHPRPRTLSPTLFVGKTSETYRIAREAPGLLERMPCYCGCFRGNGHQSNLDCYVDRHAFG